MTTCWLKSGVREVDGNTGPGRDSQKREGHLEGPRSQRACHTFEDLRKGQWSWPESQHVAYIRELWSVSQLQPLGDCEQSSHWMGTGFEGLL